MGRINKKIENEHYCKKVEKPQNTTALPLFSNVYVTQYYWVNMLLNIIESIGFNWKYMQFL